MPFTFHKSYKSKCIVQNDIPIRLQIQQHLGTSLAQVFFNYSHHGVTKFLDLTFSEKLLQSYCVTQDNRLKINMNQTKPEKQEIFKSQIHRDILALGDSTLKIFQAEIETAAQRKLKTEFIDKCYMFEAEKRFAVERNSKEIHSRYENYLKSIQQNFQKQLQVELEDVTAKKHKELQKAIVKTRLDTTYEVLQKLRTEINNIITNLYNDFQTSHCAQREKLISDFNEIMRKQNVKLDEKIKEVERDHMEKLHIQHRELNIQNVIDIIYILCMEKLRNTSQVQTIYKHFMENIKNLKKFIHKQEKTINTMKTIIIQSNDKNKMLQKKIIATVNEFQKFINFAFDAVPGHTDFLLPLDLLPVNAINKENDL